VDLLVVPVKDDVGSAQKGVAQNREVVVLGHTELADAQVRLLPDEVLVLDVDHNVAKLEVDTAGGVNDVAVHNVVARGGLQTSRGEGLEDLVHQGAGKGADGVAAVEEHRLAVGLVEDLKLGAVLLGDAHTVHMDPVAGVAIGGLGGGDDGLLGKGARELLDIDSAVGDGASVAVEATDVETESPALDEALLDQVVNDKGVGARPAAEVGTGTEDTDGSKLAVSGNTEDLLIDTQSCICWSAIFILPCLPYYPPNHQVVLKLASKQA
jgi:hypothetical protein